MGTLCHTATLLLQVRYSDQMAKMYVITFADYDYPFPDQGNVPAELRAFNSFRRMSYLG